MNLSKGKRLLKFIKIGMRLSGSYNVIDHIRMFYINSLHDPLIEFELKTVKSFFNNEVTKAKNERIS